MGRHRAVKHSRIGTAARRAVIGSAVTATALTLPATAAVAAPTGSASADGSLGSESLGSASLGSTGSLGSGSADDSLGALPIPSPRGLAALGMAMTQAGKPYVWGAEGPHAYDCSGLVQWAYAQLGIPIGRTTYDQIYEGVNVPLNNMQPGDLIIFRENNSHIGIYAGFGQVWNAYDYGVPIGLTPLADEPPVHIIRRIY